MSGEFRPEQNLTVESTDNETIARQYGLTRYDKATGLYSAPTPPDAGERESGQLAEALAENARLSDEIAELTAENAQLKERVRLADEIEQQRVTKTTGTKTSGR